MKYTPELIEELFTYHAPDENQLTELNNVRTAAKNLANAIARNTPPSADQSAAIRLLRECVMTANASIILRGVS